MDKRKIEKTKDELKTLYDILNNLPGLKKSKKAVIDAVNCIEELETKLEERTEEFNTKTDEKLQIQEAEIEKRNKIIKTMAKDCYLTWKSEEYKLFEIEYNIDPEITIKNIINYYTKGV